MPATPALPGGPLWLAPHLWEAPNNGLPLVSAKLGSVCFPIICWFVLKCICLGQAGGLMLLFILILLSDCFWSYMRTTRSADRHLTNKFCS